MELYLRNHLLLSIDTTIARVTADIVVVRAGLVVTSRAGGRQRITIQSVAEHIDFGSQWSLYDGQVPDGTCLAYGVEILDRHACVDWGRRNGMTGMIGNGGRDGMRG